MGAKTKSVSFYGAFLVGVTGMVLVVFQNCGQSPSGNEYQQETISNRSPFYDQRVRLLKVNESKLEQEEDSFAFDGEQISVLVKNNCAIESCELAPDADDSITCELISKNEIIEELRQGLQAYVSIVPEGASEESFEHQLRSNSVDDDCIAGVSYNLTYKSEATEYSTNDPTADNQYHHKVINGLEGYEYFYSEYSTARVGVIDTGIETYPETPHEDISSTSNSKISKEVYDTSACEEVCHWHGTFVSHIIGGRHNNAKGGYGILPSVSMRNFMIGNASGNFQTYQLVNALQMASYYNLDVVNMSLGGNQFLDYSLQDGMINLINKGTLIVVSAGNDGKDLGASPYYPASFNFDGQITVGAASPEDIINSTDLAPYDDSVLNSPIKRDPYSNYGSGVVHISAPGTRIYSAMLNSTYGYRSGTSFSAPMVTAAAALLKGHFRSKGVDASPLLIKSLILEGARKVDSLTEGTGAGEYMPVQQNRYLDIKKLSEVTKSFLSGIEEKPGRIELTGTRAEINSTTMNKDIVVTVDVRDATADLDYTLRAYTNSAFLASSFTGITCKILSTRQVCEIRIPYNQILIDPHIYLRVTDETGTLISELTIPKTAINTGVKSEANIIGEIVLASHFDQNASIEGWACLKGFADSLAVEVHLDRIDGPLVKTLYTDRQARGRYFDACDAPEINFGFRYAVPWYYLGREIYFVAKHPETSKSKQLKVLSHQPGYEDTSSREYQDFVFFDYNIRSADVDFNITNYEFKDWILNIEGTACTQSPYIPPVFSVALGLNDEDPFAILKAAPSLKGTLPDNIYSTREGAIQNSVSISTVSRSIAMTNPGARNVDNMGILSKGSSSFSETHDIKNFDPQTDPKKWEFLVYSDENNDTIKGIRTVTPSTSTSSSCQFNDGFSISIDVRRYFEKIAGSSSVAYRSDVYTEADILSIDELKAFLPFLKLGNSYDLDISELNFDPSLFQVRLAPAFSHRYFDVNLSYRTFTTFLKIKRQDSFFKEHQSGIFTLPEINYYGTTSKKPQNIATADLSASPELLVQPHLAIQKVDQAIATTGDNLTVAWQSPVINIPTGKQKLYPTLYFRSGEDFGYLNEDLILQVFSNTTGLWYDLDLDQVFTQEEEATDTDQVPGSFKGVLSGNNRLPNNSTTQIRFRLLSNKKNKFNIETLGYYLE